jgi:hypothetical protein
VDNLFRELLNKAQNTHEIFFVSNDLKPGIYPDFNQFNLKITLIKCISYRTEITLILNSYTHVLMLVG